MGAQTITTPTGYRVTIKEGLTFPEKRQIQRVVAHAAVYNKDTKEFEQRGSAIYDAEDETVRLMIAGIVDPQGKEIAGTDPLTVVHRMPDADAEAVYAAVKEADAAANATANLTDAQKKSLSSTSSNSTMDTAASL